MAHLLEVASIALESGANEDEASLLSRSFTNVALLQNAIEDQGGNGIDKANGYSSFRRNYSQV